MKAWWSSSVRAGSRASSSTARRRSMRSTHRCSSASPPCWKKPRPMRRCASSCSAAMARRSAAAPMSTSLLRSMPPLRAPSSAAFTAPAPQPARRMPEVRLGIPSVVEAALLPRLVGSGRAAWLVLTGEAINAQRAYEWGLVEALCDEPELDAEVARVVAQLLAGDRAALRMQKALLQQWEEQPLATCIAQSIECFAEAYAEGAPMRKLRA